MKIIFTIIWFLFSLKIFLFWLWLWQLKEYHIGRFRAHFESQRWKKITSGFWRIKFPKLTKKIIIIVLTGFLGEVIFLQLVYFQRSGAFYLLLLSFLILSPLLFSFLVLIFQIPTRLLKQKITNKAAQKIGRRKDLKVIGITGSYGKTSTKEILYTLLSGKYKVLKTKKHINSEIGIAQTILKELKEDHQFFVCEIGAYEKGKIEEVSKIIKPQIGILTGLNSQHLSTFGSQENIRKGKFELIENLTENGMAILNGNNPLVLSLESKIGEKIKKKIISSKEKADLWAEKIKVGKNQLNFRVFSKKGQSADFELNLIGKQNIENILLSVLTAQEMGISLERSAQVLRDFKLGIPVISKGDGGFNVIDASYSANPQSVISHIEHLRNWKGKRAVVMPCLIELGEFAGKVHYEIGEKIGQICNLALITTSDYFSEVKKGFLNSKAKGKIFLVEDPKEISLFLENFRGREDIILLESRVPSKLKKFLTAKNGY